MMKKSEGVDTMKMQRETRYNKQAIWIDVDPADQQCQESSLIVQW